MNLDSHGESLELHDVEAQRAHAFAQAPPSILRWLDVGCVVMDRSGVTGRRILQGCCGEAVPGELVAIVGPSGKSCHRLCFCCVVVNEASVVQS